MGRVGPPRWARCHAAAHLAGLAPARSRPRCHRGHGRAPAHCRPARLRRLRPGHGSEPGRLRRRSGRPRGSTRPAADRSAGLVGRRPIRGGGRRRRPRRPGGAALAAGQPGAGRRGALGDGCLPGLAAGRARGAGGSAAHHRRGPEGARRAVRRDRAQLEGTRRGAGRGTPGRRPRPGRVAARGRPSGRYGHGLGRDGARMRCRWARSGCRRSSGTADADAIGPTHGEWYASRLPQATLTVLPSAGHLLPVANWRRILEAATG